MTMPRLLSALFALLLLAGCAEINKPIRPGDHWREKAEGITGVPQD